MAGKLLSGLGGLHPQRWRQQYAQSAQLSYAKGYYGSTDPQLDRDIKNANANATAFAGAAAQSFASISRRFNATRQANDVMSVLTNFGNSNTAKDAGVMMIDKTQVKKSGRSSWQIRKTRIINSMNWAVCCIINLMETKYRDLHSDPPVPILPWIVKAITSVMAFYGNTVYRTVH